MKKPLQIMIFAGLLVCGMAPAQQAPVKETPRQKSGVQLWQENCGTCHNLRNPAGYSDAQWEVAVQHMRIRANLTAQEARAIAEFLKAAN